MPASLHPDLDPSVDAFVQYEDCWPAGKPFPFSAEECKALVMGYALRLPQPMDMEAFLALPGRWEGGGTFVVLWRT